MILSTAAFLPIPSVVAAADLICGIMVFFLALRKKIVASAAVVILAPFAPEMLIGHTTLSATKCALVGGLAALLIRAYRDNALGTLKRFSPFVLPLTGLIAATALTWIPASYHEPVLRETAKATEYLGAALLAGLSLEKTGDRRCIVWTILAVSLLVACAALAQERLGAPSVFLVGLRTVPRIAGPLEGPNQLSAYLALVLPWLVAQEAFLRPKPAARPWRIAAGTVCFFLSVVTLLAAEFLTFSRAGIVTTLIALAFVFCFRRQALETPYRNLGGYAAVFGILIGSVAAFALSGGSFSHLSDFDDSGPTGGVGHRSLLWRAALFFWQSSPLLGIGAGNFEYELARVGVAHVRTHANSLYLQALAEGGVTLASVTVLSLLVPLRRIAKNVKQSTLLLGTLGAGLGFALHNVVDTLTFFPKIGLVWWMLVGMCFADPKAILDPKAS